MKKYEQFYNIRLCDIKGFFGYGCLMLLSKINITTLGSLFEYLDTNIMEFTPKKYPKYYNEIMGNVKLLKYLYLDIDPKFDENSTLSELGFTTYARTPLWRYGYSTGTMASKKDSAMNLILLLNDSKQFQNFSKIHSVGICVITEVEQKVKIINRYFNNKDMFENSSDSLIDLYRNLNDLLNEKKNLEKQIENVRIKIKKIEHVQKEIVG